MENIDLKRRIVDISYKRKLNHIGSCICCVDIIKDIYDEMIPYDKFVLSAGHAGLALYVVLEEKYKKSAEEYVNEVGVHPERKENNFIDCSTGSLGQGLPIAIGMALADHTRTVYCVVSDGECAEGSIWESFRLINDMDIKNIRVFVVVNGWGAYGEIDIRRLMKRIKSFCPSVVVYDVSDSMREFPVLGDIGNEAHYRVLSEENYNDIMEELNG